VDTVAINSSLGASIKPYAPRVFVSATTGDLGSYRKIVCDELLKAKCLPIVQDYFRCDPRRLCDFLEDEIRPCEAVICLLGPRFGEAPDCEGQTPRSYTQFEYDAARRNQKDVYVFLASDSCPLDGSPDEPEEKRLLQQQHIAAVQRKDQSICKMFSSPQELREYIVSVVSEIAKARQPKVIIQSPSPYAYFAGRQAELKQLSQAILTSGPSVVVVLGVAGQGKTTLTWEWFTHHLPDVFAGAFWCPAEENQFTFDMFVDLALGYLMRGKYDKRSFRSIQERIRLLVQHLRDRPCLLVIDGLEKWLRAWTHRGDIASADCDSRLGGQEGLDLFLSQLGGVTGPSRFVLTSRVLPAVLDRAPHAVIPVLDELAQARLRGLDDAAAVALLRSLGVRCDEQGALAIARAYDNHPLSLTILGKLASRRYGGSVERFKTASRLVHDDRNLISLLDEMQQALPARDDSQHLLDLRAHFIETPSLGQFSHFLRWLAIHEHHLDLVARLALHVDDDALREALAVLDDWSLISWDRQDDSLHMHPMLGEHFRASSTRSPRIHAALSRWYLDQPVDDAKSLPEMRRRILAVEHALQAGEAALCDDAVLSAAGQSSSLSEWLARWGHQSTGIDLLTRVVGLCPQPQRSLHLISRGAMRTDLGRLTPAREDLTDAIGYLDAAPWRRRRHRQVLAGAYMNRGTAFASSGNPLQAVADADRALRVLTWPFGLVRRCPAMMADILTNRGAANREMGCLDAAQRDTSEAIRLYQRCQATQREEGGYFARRIATALLNRGNARSNARQYELADRDYLQAMESLSHADLQSDDSAAPLRAMIHEMRALLLNDTEQWSTALGEHDAATDTLAQLVQQGRSDCRIPLAHSFVNRVHTLIALDRLDEACLDAQTAKRIYNQETWEQASTLAIWLAANQSILAGIGRILKMDMSIGNVSLSLSASWETLSTTQGPYTLAPFVRSAVGCARLVFPYDPQFSTDSLCDIVQVLQGALEGGYHSQWMMWEVHDLCEFVSAHRDELARRGLPVERVDWAYEELQRHAARKGGSC